MSIVNAFTCTGTYPSCLWGLKRVRVAAMTDVSVANGLSAVVGAPSLKQSTTHIPTEGSVYEKTILALLTFVRCPLHLMPGEEIPRSLWSKARPNFPMESIRHNGDVLWDNLPAKETILKILTKSVSCFSITKQLQTPVPVTRPLQSRCRSTSSTRGRWLEAKYPGKKCEDFKLPNRTIKVMRFGDDTDGYYMIEKSVPVQGMYLVMISLYNDKLSQLEDREAKEFASRKMTEQSAPLQFSVQQVNNNLNQGKPIYPVLTNSVAQVAAQQSPAASAFDETKETMGAIRSAIERHQQQTKSRRLPKTFKLLKQSQKVLSEHGKMDGE